MSTPLLCQYRKTILRQSRKHLRIRYSAAAAFSSSSKHKNEWTSPPNLISMTRIACTPVISYWIVTQQYEYAAAGCFLAGFSDYIDGHLAKHYNMKTVLGSYLDPLADKLLINVVAISIWYQPAADLILLPTPLVVLWCVKDVVLMGATVRLWNQQPAAAPLIQVHPTQISKINTALQFVTLTTCVLNPWICQATLEPVLYSLWWMTGTTTVLSMLDYVGTTAIHDNNNNNEPSDGDKMN